MAERHLPSAHSNPFDIVIRHSRLSGPAAASLRDRWYPRARLAHFLHTSSVRLDWVRGRREKGARNPAAVAVSEPTRPHR
ncbi:hypothetical protein ACWD4B_03030 [Streptomyces sp. NPDC002536]